MEYDVVERPGDKPKLSLSMDERQRYTEYRHRSRNLSVKSE